MSSGPVNLDPRQLERAASERGFQAGSLEKVLRLLDLLRGLYAHPYLAPRLALKGGTALNLFMLDMPRLSVDVDLNYVGAVDRETMQAERGKVESAIVAVCERYGFRVRRVPEDHAGGKWRLGYDRAHGGTATLELDLNFLLRVPLWPVTRLDGPGLLGVTAEAIPILDPHELAGGKFAALFNRTASRDLYDAVRLLEAMPLDRGRLRTAFVLYGAMSRRDWRQVSVDEIEILPRDATSSLLPMLRADLVPGKSQVEAWCRSLTERCRERLSSVLPLQPNEVEFLGAMHEHAELRPELLVSEAALQERIRRHPALRWKIFHLQRHLGKNAPETDADGESPDGVP